MASIKSAIFLLGAALFSTTAAAAAAVTTPIVAGKSLSGNLCPLPIVTEFRGIRYGESTAARWKAPVAALTTSAVTANNTKTKTGTYLATTYGSDCPQNPLFVAPLQPDAGTLGVSEDCLFLNVYTPTANSSNLPVLVYFHGGAYIAGAGRVYDACNVVAESILGNDKAIVVTVNYRLGMFGLLALDALQAESGAGNSTGAYWFLDQQLALKWVKSNIASFGGNPSKVTIWGESAGADSVAHHIGSPSSKGLFQAAILQSFANLIAPIATTKQIGYGAAVTFNCTTAAGLPDVACLRSKSVSELLSNPNAARWLSSYGTPQLPLPPATMVKNKNFNDVPTIVGYNQDEGTLFTYTLLIASPLGNAASIGTGVIDDALVPAFVAAWYNLNPQTVPADAQKVGAILARYPASNYTQFKTQATFQRISAILTGGFKSASYGLVRALSASKAKKDAYLYKFVVENKCYVQQLYSLPPWAPDAFETTHGLDVPWTFGYFKRNYAGIDCSMTVRETLLSLEMIARWRRLSSQGAPNTLLTPLTVAWPAYDAAKTGVTFQSGQTTANTFAADEADATFFQSLGI